MFYTILKQDDVAVLTVLHNGHALVATSESHPHYEQLVADVIAGDETVIDRFDISSAVTNKLAAQLTDRVELSAGILYIDGNVVDDSIANQIVRFYQEGVDDWTGLVRFLEKLQANPSEHSREQLYRWLNKHAFSITTYGDIVGYKSVGNDWRSIHSGQEDVLVNGVVHRGKIPNEVGSVIEMDRTLVAHDPTQSCSVGLHVANWSYAASWTGSSVRMLEVHVNPADVVSVPTDSNDAKMRVSKYRVVRQLDKAYESALVAADSDMDDLDGDEDYENSEDCYYCDGRYCDGDCEWADDDVATTDVTKAVTVDTRLNHTKQQRDAFGKFIKRV